MGWPYQQKPPSGWPLDYDSGLVPEAGFWLMNEGSGNKVFDLSGNGLIGTLNSGVTIVPGKFGSGLSFDNTVDAYVSFSGWKAIQNDLTYVGWALVRTVSVAGAPLIGQGSTRLDLLLENPPRGHYYNGTTFIKCISTVNYVLNIWNQFAFTKSSTLGTCFYLNGVLTKEEPTQTDNATAQNTLHIGYPALNYEFDGIADHILFYNRALSASEIALLSSQPFCMFKDPAELILTAAGQTVAGINIPLLMQQMNQFNGGMAA